MAGGLSAIHRTNVLCVASPAAETRRSGSTTAVRSGEASRSPVIGENSSQQTRVVQRLLCGSLGASFDPQWWAAFAGEAKAADTTQWFATANQRNMRNDVKTRFNIGRRLIVRRL
jgi:hypothetical protein